MRSGLMDQDDIPQDTKQQWFSPWDDRGSVFSIWRRPSVDEVAKLKKVVDWDIFPLEFNKWWFDCRSRMKTSMLSFQQLYSKSTELWVSSIGPFWEKNKKSIKLKLQFRFVVDQPHLQPYGGCILPPTLTPVIDTLSHYHLKLVLKVRCVNQ